MGPPIIGALQAVADAGSSALVVGFDAGPDELAAIAAGTELGSVAQFPDQMGSMGAQAALDAINGVAVEPNIDTGTAMVTAETSPSSWRPPARCRRRRPDAEQVARIGHW